MKTRMRIMYILVCLWLMCGCKAGKEEAHEIVLSGPPVTASFPLVYMAEQSLLHGYGKIRFIPWKNPDQMRALVAGGQVDIVVLATNASACLYNKGIPLTQLTISLPGSGQIISRLELRRVLDLKGKHLVMPFRGDIPDILMRMLLKEHSLTAGKDYQVLYCGSSVDALQLYYSGRADAAFVSDVAADVARDRLTKGEKDYNSLKLHSMWEKTFQGRALPVSGIACVGKNSKNSEFLHLCMSAYQEAARWCHQHPQRAAAQVVKYFPSLRKESVIRRIRQTDFEYCSATELKEELHFFFKILMKENQAIIGNTIPGDDFYWDGK